MEPKALEGRAAEMESGHLAAFHMDEVVGISFDDEPDNKVEPLVSPRELVVWDGVRTPSGVPHG